MTQDGTNDEEVLAELVTRILENLPLEKRAEILKKFRNR